MSIAENFYNFSEEVFEDYGFGNDKLLIAFGISSLISLLAVGGVFIPPLGLLINGLLPLLLGGGVFAAAAVLTNFDLGGIVVGGVLGLITGYVGYAFIASLLYVAPATSAFFLTPNVVAAGAYAGGGFFSCMEGVWNGIKNCCSSLASCLCCCFRDSGSDEPKQEKKREYPSMNPANAKLNSKFAPPPGGGRPSGPPPPSYQSGSATGSRDATHRSENTTWSASQTNASATPGQGANHGSTDTKQGFRR